MLVSIFICLLCSVGLKGQCVCDLQQSSCEIGCCCDSDCSQADVSSFETCTDEPVLTKKCIPFTIVRANNNPNVDVTTEGSQTCVTDNSPNTDLTLFRNAECTERDDCDFYLPPVPNSTVFDGSSLNGTFYKSGVPIYTISLNRTAGFLSLPTSSEYSSGCQLESVKYLMNTSSACQISLDTVQDCNSTEELQINYYTSSFYILKQLEFLDLSSGVNSTTGLLFLDFNCTDEVSGTDIDCTSIPTLLPNNTCTGAVKAVSFQIKTDGLRGITNASAIITIGSFTEDDLPLQNSFNVEFVSAVVENNPVVGIQPNYGYLFGQEIKTESQYTLSLVGYSGSNTCSGDFRRPLRFGESAASSCIATFSRDTLCTDLQDSLTKFLKGTDFPANNSLIVPISNKPFSDAIQVIVGEIPTAANTTDTVRGGCTNLAIGAEYKILYSQNGSVGNSQTFISAASLTFLTTNLTFVCRSTDCLRSGLFKVDVVTSVTFDDITQTRGREADPIPAEKWFSFVWPVTIALSSPYIDFYVIKEVIPTVIVLMLLFLDLFIFINKQFK